MKIVGVAGSLRTGSSTGVLVSRVLSECRKRGATVQLLAGEALDLPQYDPSRAVSPEARRLLEAVRGADALVLGSPAYHGGISGTMKMALDYLEELRADPRVYLAGMPVASVVTGAGWQGVSSTLGHLRDVVHALRGWNVPLGITVNVLETKISPDADLPAQIDQRVSMMVDELTSFLDVRARCAFQPAV
jgi:FMN reductase